MPSDMPITVAEALASKVCAIRNCERSGNTEWRERHAEALRRLIREFLPHGSGFDGSITCETDRSNEDTLRFFAPFHRMDSNGYYCGWVDFTVRARASFIGGLSVKVTGGRDPQLREYVAETFHAALSARITQAQAYPPPDRAPTIVGQTTHV